MDPTVTFLLSVGLCLEWVIRAQMDTLPRPTLWAVPSAVVSRGADVTLRCQGQPGREMFQLWQDGELREERNASGHLAEFSLWNVEGLRDARSYSCRYGQGALWSELSEPLAVVVTGVFPKPLIAASPQAPVAPGTAVAIGCRGPIVPATLSGGYTFALLEAESLELLQRRSPAGTTANFSLPAARALDTGSYRCVYYKKTAPHRGSAPSQALELTVLGPWPKPSLWAQPGLVVVPGTDVTLWCSRPKLLSPQEKNFTLWKAGRQQPLQNRSSAQAWTGFLLSSVGLEDAGSYRCAYGEPRGSARDSEPSDALELMVTGSLPKPSLSALPSLVVEPGTHLTLQCRQPLQSPLWGVTFALLKAGTPQPLQSQSPAGTSAVFPLLSVRAQDAGNYSCIYHGKEGSQVSEPSEVLEIWVTGAPLGSYPRPSCRELKTDSIEKDYTTENLIQIGLSTLILIILGFILGDACNDWRRSEDKSSKRDPRLE